jgi:hypothetical protein
MTEFARRRRRRDGFTPISTAGKLINLSGFLTREFLRICCCEPPGD